MFVVVVVLSVGLTRVMLWQEVGHYVSNWRLRSPSGLFFGHQVWADIMVVKENARSNEPALRSDGVNAEEESENEEGDEQESEWEMGRSKVRRIVKISRRSHSDVDSEYEMVGNDESEDDDEHDEVTTQQPSVDVSVVLPQEDESDIRAGDKERADEEMEKEVEVKIDQSPVGEDDEWEVVPKEEWADEIAALQEMCLGDLDTIRRVLKEAKGNVHLAAQSLLGE
jgi:hypothetical protein